MKRPDTRNTPPKDADTFLLGMRSAIERYQMFANGDHVVVAVSGGADSTALLHGLLELAPQWDLRLTVAHLNHGLRGAEAQQEADFVETLAKKNGVPCISEVRDVKTTRQESGECLQEAARSVRYDFLHDVMKRCKAQKLALGHTMDDQAETVLIRLLRGASTLGLGGIPPVGHSGIVRPLINVRRTDIEHFLQERGIEFVPDNSVDEQHYVRNKIRHELLPMLVGQYNPRITETLCSTAELARSDEAILQEQTALATDKALRVKGDCVHIPISLFKRFPLLAGRIMRRAFELQTGSCRGLTSAHTHAAVSLIDCRGSDKQVPLPGDITVRLEYDELVMCAATAPSAFHIQCDQLPVDISLPESNTRVRIHTLARKDIDELKPTGIGDTVHLAAESVSLPIIIRSWKPGDRMRPFGFNGEKKIKAVFADEKVPVRLRGRIPIIESDGRIVSLGTLRISEDCRIGLGCQAVLAVTINNVDAG